MLGELSQTYQDHSAGTERNQQTYHCHLSPCAALVFRDFHDSDDAVSYREFFAIGTTLYVVLQCVSFGIAFCYKRIATYGCDYACIIHSTNERLFRSWRPCVI